MIVAYIVSHTWCLSAPSRLSGFCRFLLLTIAILSIIHIYSVFLLAHMRTILFWICFRTVHFSARYPLQLASASYSPESELASFTKAYHYWLLIEILNSISNHSILILSHNSFNFCCLS